MAGKEWPSEDEDFDAVSNKKGGRKSVAVVDNSEDVSVDEVVPPKESAVEGHDVVPAAAVVETNEAETATEGEAFATSTDVPKEPKPLNSRASAPAAKKSSFGRLVLEIVLVLAVIGLGLLAWSLSSDRNNLKKQVSQLNTNPQFAVQKQTQDLINHVSSLIQLPQDETPTVANVTDATKARQQSAFFNNAQNGDKVLMYVKTGEAILYRPSTNKIVLVAPLTFNNNSAAASTATGKSTTPTSTGSTSKTTTSTNGR